MSKEELGDVKLQGTNDNVEMDDQIVNTLLELMERKKITFDELRDKMVLEEIDGANQFESIKDIPNSIVFDLIARLKKKS